MKIEITTSTKEIADLVLALQGQQIHEVAFKCNTTASSEELAKIVEKSCLRFDPATKSKMNEYQIIAQSLISTLGFYQTVKIAEQFKTVAKENNLDRSEKLLHDFLRMVEIQLITNQADFHQCN